MTDDRMTAEYVTRIDGRQIASVLVRGWVALLLAVIIGVAAGWTYGQEKGKTYSSTAQVEVGNTLADLLLQGQGAETIDPKILQATQNAILSSRAVEQLAKQRLGHDPQVQIVEVSGSQLIAVTARSSSAQGSARDANGYVSAYIAYSQRQTNVSLESLRRHLTRSVAKITGSLARPKTISRAQQTSLRNQLSQANGQLATIGSALATAPTAVVVASTAQRPSEPSGFSSTFYAVLGAVIMFLIGITILIWRSTYRRRVRTNAELEAVTGVPVLGTVSTSQGLGGSSEVGLIYAQVIRTLDERATTVQVCGLERSASVDLCAEKLSEDAGRLGRSISISAQDNGSQHSAGVSSNRQHEALGYGNVKSVAFVSTPPIDSEDAAYFAISSTDAIILVVSRKWVEVRKLYSFVRLTRRLGVSFLGIVRVEDRFTEPAALRSQAASGSHRPSSETPSPTGVDAR